MWLIPPHFALWIPAYTQHRIHMPGAVSMRTLYFRRGLVSGLPSDCAVLHVSPLLRELIVEAARIGQLRTRNPIERAIRDLAVSHLKKASTAPTVVALPREPRARAVAQFILETPGQSKSLVALCADSGVSVRTIQRSFRKEIGIGFESWRRQVRLIKALELLVAGYSVKEVAFAVGYKQCSAFVEGFRQIFGTTPRAWTLALEKLDERRVDLLC